MSSTFSRLVVCLMAVVAFSLTGCGGTGSGFSSGGTVNGTVTMMVSDAPANDWATVGVKLLSISLHPAGGGTQVNVYSAPSGVFLNLVQLDQLSEILGNLSVPAGTYDSALLTLGGNPGDVILTASEDPDLGFPLAPSATVPPSQIQIQGASGSTGSLTVAAQVDFVSNLAVVAGQSVPLDLEFDLSHPAFIVAHVPPASGTVEWAVNFNGPWVRHHPIQDITRRVLRDIYGNANSVSSDSSSLSITKVFPAEPPTNPETAIASLQTLTILADTSNGTIVYDLDARTHSTVFDFSSLSASVGGRYVRVVARFQVNGTLTGARIWVSTSFDKVWQNPEGHVLHVNTLTNFLTVENETGHGVRLQVVDGGNPTQFYFRMPSNAPKDAIAIGQGTAFLSNIKRGFKVHVKVVDPLAVPLVADTVDIEAAKFDGQITNTQSSTSGGFDYTRIFATPADSYTNFALPYISPNTPNGKDPLSGSAITGFKWWNFAFPTLVSSNVTDTSQAQTILDFFAATNTSVNFGGTVGALPAYGKTYALWGDPANVNGWSAPSAVLLPTPVPLGTVVTGYSAGAFTMNAIGGATPATMDVSTVSGSATLVYQVNRTGAIVTVTTVDLTTTAGLTLFTTTMTAGRSIRVAGLPEPSGHIKAYVIFYYTGVIPAT